MRPIRETTQETLRLHLRPPPYLRHVCAALFCGALLVSPAFGQYQRNPPRTITGTVTDGGHEPLRGAVVQIETEGSMTIQSFVTDERGIYHFRNLNPDADYQVWATFRGMHSKHENVSKFDHKQDREIPLKIELAK
jgi:hypothetical protein